MIKYNCTFDADKQGTVLQIALRGEIDHHSAVAIRSGMDSLLYKIRPRRLYLDLSGVDFMDSSGLGLIMGRYALMKEIGGDVVVCEPCAGVERVMKLAGLEKLVRIEKNKAEDKDANKPRTKRVRKEVLK